MQYSDKYFLSRVRVNLDRYSNKNILFLLKRAERPDKCASLWSFRRTELKFERTQTFSSYWYYNRFSNIHLSYFNICAPDLVGKFDELPMFSGLLYRFLDSSDCRVKK